MNNSIINQKFIALLAARGTSVKQICERLGLNVIHVSQVLGGRKPGKPTRRRLAKVLLPAELAELGWSQEGTTLTTLFDLQMKQEDEAVRQTVQVLQAYQSGRIHLMKLVTLVAEHPEIFGAVRDGENYLARLAGWLQQECGIRSAECGVKEEGVAA